MREWLCRLGAAMLAISGVIIVIGAPAGSTQRATHGPAFYAWGYVGNGSFGEAFNANEVSSPIPVSLPDGLVATSISTNGDYTLAIASSGALYAWGDGTYGRLGDGSTSSSVTPVAVDLPAGVTAVSIAAGSSSALAIGSDGFVYAWGDNSAGQLGQGYTGAPPGNPTGPTFSSTPLKVLNADGVTFQAVSTNGYSMAEISSAGVLSMWGSNGEGQLGNGGTSDSNLPSTVDLVAGSTPQIVASVSVGGAGNVVASTTAGAAYSWGYDAEGQLGNFTGQWSGYPSGVYPVLTPTQLAMPPSVGLVTQVSAGTYDGYALTTTGTLVAWGADAYGGLGNGVVPTEDFYTSAPVVVESPPGGGVYTQVSAGSVSVAALTSTGAVESWGQDADGEFGNGTATSSITYDPVTASLPAGVTPWAVNSGGTVTYVLSDAGPPVFTSADGAAWDSGTPGTFTVTTQGAPAASLVESGALPQGVTFTDNGDGTGSLVGTPAAGTGGTYDLSFLASNSFEDGVPQSFTLTIDGPPTFTSPALAAFAPGVDGSFTVRTAGLPHATITLTGGTLPPGLSFADRGDGTATISGKPTGGIRTSRVTLTATNGLLPNARQTLRLSVQRPPSFTSPSATSFTAGRRGSFAIATSSTPVAVVTTASSLPSGLSFSTGPKGTATIQGKAAAGAGGIYRITLQAANPLLTVQHLKLTVDAKPTFLGPLPLRFPIGRSSSSFVTFTTGFPAHVRITCTALPRGLKFKDLGGGNASISGEPSGSARTVNITMTAANSTGSTSAKVPIDITNGGPPS